jgi:predicted hydrolase (HD superfamily)
MSLPTRAEAQKVLEKYTKDEYLLYHASMVAAAMGGYGELLGEDVDLWYITGLLHDLDFDMYPDIHPAQSVAWLKEWGYPDELIYAIEAHAYDYSDPSLRPKTKLASALLACDEISGIFYAYKKLNPISYGEMKVSSIKKRLAEKTFAAKIDRSTIYLGCETLGVSLDDHIANLVRFF